ncbi:hypothetical protein COOONC_09496 [Cooperia oncophora]
MMEVLLVVSLAVVQSLPPKKRTTTARLHVVIVLRGREAVVAVLREEAEVVAWKRITQGKHSLYFLLFSRSRSPDFARNEALRDSWAALKAQPNNFDAWIILLTQADQSNDVKLAREMYDRFLAKYPYCYGFWKKYADMERRHQNFSDALNASSSFIHLYRFSVKWSPKHTGVTSFSFS